MPIWMVTPMITKSRFKRTMCAVSAAVMLTLPGCIPQALAADGPTDAMISTASALTAEYDLPNGLLLAVADVESGFDPYCKTGKCIGLMQIHSSYAAGFAEDAGLDSYDLYDPEDSMRIAAAILDGYMDKYPGDLHMVLMCYNLGEAGAKSKRRAGYDTTGYSRKVAGKIDHYAECGAKYEELSIEAGAPAVICVVESGRMVCAR